MNEPAPPSQRLRIGIGTIGRFHVLDLARELDQLGHHVTLYSAVPPARAASFGLPARAQEFMPELLPLAAAARWAPRTVRKVAAAHLVQAGDWAIRRRLKPCDVFIGMSGLVLKSAAHARARFGAKVVIERGSQHVLAQKAILEATPGSWGPSDLDVSREVESYALADLIAVPSQRAVESFRENAVPAERLFCNPYGVDFGIFDQAQHSQEREPGLVLFVGLWSLQKGCDLLAAAIDRLPDAHLLHLGATGDLAFPQHPRMRSLGHVDQARLPDFYARAMTLALPSRQDGFGLVLCQALAANTPIVASEDTGGPDLIALGSAPGAVSIVKSGDIDDLTQALASALDQRRSVAGRELLSPTAREALSWSAYGRRASAALQVLADRQ